MDGNLSAPGGVVGYTKRSFAALLVLVVTLLASAVSGGGEPGRAHACSYTRDLDLRWLSDREERVVAVGNVIEASPTVAKFLVEEGLRGAKKGDILSINNAVALNDVGPDCSRRIGGGPNYPTGVRSLVILRTDTFGVTDWDVSVFGNAMYPLDGEALTHLSWPIPFVRLDDALAVLGRLASNVYPEFERGGNCEAFSVPDLWTSLLGASGTTLVVRGDVVGTEDKVARVRLREVFKGSGRAGDEVRVDGRWTTYGEGCSVVPEDEAERFTDGEEVILFLVPSDTGVGDWRLALWGSGALAVRGTRVQIHPAMPTLSQVRAALAGRPGPALPRTAPNVLAPPDAREQPGAAGAAGSSSGDSRWPLIAGVGGLAAAALAAWGARRASNERG